MNNEKVFKAGAGLKRLTAYIVDILVLIAIYIPIGLLFKNALTNLLIHGTGSGAYILLTLAIFVLPSIYLILMWHFVGATVGLLVFRLRLVEISTGKKPALFIALWRYMIFLLSWFSLFIGFLWMLWDSRQQNWSDKLAGTVVIPRGEELPGAASEKDIRNWKRGKILVLASVFVLIIVNVIWQYEVPLSAGALATLGTYGPEENPGGNGFYELPCFGAGSDVDAFELGLKEIEKVNASTMALYKSAGFWGQKYDVEMESIYYNSLGNDLDTLMTISDAEDFWGEIAANREMIERNFQKYDYLEERYNRLGDYEYYQTRLFPDIFVEIPIFLPLVKYQRLYCANICLQYMDNNREEAIANYLNSIRIVTHLMEQSDYLITKLIAIVLYIISQDTCAELINYEKEIDPGLAEAILNLPELSAAAKSFRKAVYGEFNLGASYLVRLIESPQGFQDYKIDKEDVQKANPPFIKANQILNIEFKFWELSAELSELPQWQFNQEYQHKISVKINWLEYINNPLGVILANQHTTPVYTSYFVIAQDLEIRDNLLKAACAIKLNNIERSEIPDYLEANKEKWGNLYLNEALDWNAETSELFFRGPLQEDKKEQRKIFLAN
ncbi:MAG: RDD family protein [Candidatus Cloacimonetes bacterium]|nr:RDD family protein [Candidatus Cloacimonadota bacterium]